MDRKMPGNCYIHISITSSYSENYYENKIKKEEKSSHFTFDAWLIRMQETDGFITLLIVGKKGLRIIHLLKSFFRAITELLFWQDFVNYYLIFYNTKCSLL